MIVANGTLPPIEIIASILAKNVFVLAADGGADKLLHVGIVPDAILGDFDSVSTDVPHSIPRIYRPDQDHTDLDKAVTYLLEQDYRSIWITGATGDRLDHTFGALSVLIKHGNAANIALIDSVGTARLIVGSTSFDTEPGQIVSLLGLGRVDGITTSGLKWNLAKEFLEPGVRDGISNEAVADSVEVAAASGPLIVYVHHV